jgi:hypothetical protein
MMNEVKLFDLLEYNEITDLSHLLDDEVQQIKMIKSLEHCDTYLERHKSSGRDDFMRVLRQIKAGLSGMIETRVDPFDWECFEALCRYEQTRRDLDKSSYQAKLLRKSGKTRPWQEVLERTVTKPLDEETTGFKSLRENGRLDSSFECFILNNPDKFSDVAIAYSFKRLRQNGWIVTPDREAEKS